MCVPFRILHLLFADDVLIFCSLDCEQFLYLKCVLVCFEAKTSFRINLGKSELVPIKYLGLPLGLNFNLLRNEI